MVAVYTHVSLQHHLSRPVKAREYTSMHPSSDWDAWEDIPMDDTVPEADSPTREEKDSEKQPRKEYESDSPMKGFLKYPRPVPGHHATSQRAWTECSGSVYILPASKGACFSHIKVYGLQFNGVDVPRLLYSTTYVYASSSSQALENGRHFERVFTSTSRSEGSATPS
ncbi:hypothetical protein VNI00_018931 [Paramarasmius palmivorus]|uniref:Uncharacterized protein n=1 Tax=Paramarasmius palmivorus TaxID=297713 RepID=A0AAW0AW45_9AGAR